MIKENIHKIFYLIQNNKFLIQKFPDNNEFININNQDDYKESLIYINKTYNK
jgi:molybdopterin-guanine dinucleotide biosynthesis protein A